MTDSLKEQFFGTYGALNDKFGVRWMFQSNQTLRRTAIRTETNIGANEMKYILLMSGTKAGVDRLSRLVAKGY